MTVRGCAVKKEKVIPISVAVSPDLAHKARVQAAMEGKSRSQFVREVLEQALGDAPAQAGPVRAEGNFRQLANLPGYPPLILEVGLL